MGTPCEMPEIIKDNNIVNDANRATDKARKSVITHWKSVKTHWKIKKGVKYVLAYRSTH